MAAGHTVKNGRAHLDSLRDGRSVYIDGREVADVTTHAAFRGGADTIARMYDHQADPRHVEAMTFPVDGSGLRANRAWQLPTSYAELVQRRQALESWAEVHLGFMGRAPDHVASCIAAMRMGHAVFEAHGKGRGAALEEYYRYARDRDLYLAYVIIDPQADRSKATGEQRDPFHTAAICDEDGQGITIKGAKMLGTGAVMANEVLVASLRPVREGDEMYAFTACVPIGAKGVKLLSRRSYAAAASSDWDYPLASRLDENDAVIYFDEVRIPWDRVFVHRNPRMSFAQFHDTPAHVYQNYQSMIRLAVKMRFFVGLARRITDTIGTGQFPQVKDTLGLLASQSQMIDAYVHAMEAKGWKYGDYFVPDRATLYSASVQAQRMYPAMIETLRDLSGGAMIMLPSSHEDFANPDVERVIEKVQQSPATDPRGRVKLFKLAWDAVGSEFASRHTQYEMFYSGPKQFTAGHMSRTYDWDRATGLVDRTLGAYELPAAAPRKVA